MAEWYEPTRDSATPDHPNALPDEVSRKLADLAREHGYGIQALTLTWLTKDLGAPPTARVHYTVEDGQERERLRDAAALAALPAVLRLCQYDTPQPVETREQMFARKAWAAADAFIAARGIKTDD